jgi:putative two-component system response regulator
LSVSAKSTRTVRAPRGTRGRSGRASKRPPAAKLAEALEEYLERDTLLDPSFDAVLAAHPDGVIASWSEGAESLFGYEDSEVAGEHLSLLWGTERVAELEAALARASAGEPVGGVEIEAVGKSGQPLRVCVTAAPLRADDGAPLGVAVLARECDARTPATHAPAETQFADQVQEALLEALHDAVLLQDDGGRVIAANARAREMLGLAEQTEEVSEQSLTSFIYEDGSPVPANDLPLRASLRSGASESDVVVGLREADGHVRWFAVNSVPVPLGGAGAPYAAASAFMDITDARETSRELSSARLEDLKRLALVSEYRNDETHQHTERVARGTALVAMEMGLERELAWTIARAAPLHDVGKVGIPDSVLLKPGKLTAEEFELMKKHTSIGGRILGESGYAVLRMGGEIALSHHERWDGRGYPSGLSGEQIPVSGRIVAVTDAFDAMTHPRPYKAAISVPQALAELERCSGSQFDPAVVRAFMTLDHESLVDRD